MYLPAFEILIIHGFSTEFDFRLRSWIHPWWFVFLWQFLLVLAEIWIMMEFWFYGWMIESFKSCWNRFFVKWRQVSWPLIWFFQVGFSILNLIERGGKVWRSLAFGLVTDYIQITELTQTWPFWFRPMSRSRSYNIKLKYFWTILWLQN